MEQALERSYLDMDIPIQKNETEDAFRGMKNLGCVQGEYNRKTQTIDEFDNNRLNGYKSELQSYGEFVKFSGSDFLLFILLMRTTDLVLFVTVSIMILIYFLNGQKRRIFEK